MTDRAYAKLIDGADLGKGDGGTDARRSRSCTLKLGDVARCSERSQRRIESEFSIVRSARSKNAPEEISASETNVNAEALGDCPAKIHLNEVRARRWLRPAGTKRMRQ